MEDTVGPPESGRGRSGVAGDGDLEWTPATTEVVFNAFLRTLFREPPSRTEHVNLSRVMQRFEAQRTPTPTPIPTPIPPPTYTFHHPATPDLLSMGVCVLWALLFTLTLCIYGCIRRSRKTSSTPTTTTTTTTNTTTLLPCHSARSLALLTLTLVQVAVCAEGVMRYLHSQGPHVLIIPGACASTFRILGAFVYYSYAENKGVHGVVLGVSALVWACGCGVGIIRVWVVVLHRGVSVLLVYPVLVLVGVVLQLGLLAMDVASFFFWIYTQTHTEVLSITPTVEDTMQMTEGVCRGVGVKVVGVRKKNKEGVGEREVGEREVGEREVGEREVGGGGVGGDKDKDKINYMMADKNKYVDDKNKEKINYMDDKNKDKINYMDDKNKERINYIDKNKEKINYMVDKDKEKINYMVDKNKEKINYIDKNKEKINYMDDKNKDKINVVDDKNKDKYNEQNNGVGGGDDRDRGVGVNTSDKGSVGVNISDRGGVGVGVGAGNTSTTKNSEQPATVGVRNGRNNNNNNNTNTAHNSEQGVGGGGVGGGGVRYLHAHASLLSRASFSWFLHALRLGWKRPLEFSDFARLPHEEEARTQYERFLRQYNQAKVKLTNSIRLTTTTTTTTTKQKQQEGVTATVKKTKDVVGLWGVFWSTYWRDVCAGGVFKLLGDSVNVVAPLAIALVVSYVCAYQEGNVEREGEVVDQEYFVAWKEYMSNGWVVACVALVAALLQSTFSQRSTHLVSMEGVRVRAALQAMVYCKALRLPSSTPPVLHNNTSGSDDTPGHHPSHDAGTVINLCAEDADNIMTFFTHCHYLWAIPLKVGMIMFLLWLQLGLSAVCGGVVGIILLTPLQFLLCKMIATVNNNFLTVNDERVRQTHELVTGMKLIKIHAWEDVFVKRIVTVREKELALLRRDSILRALMTFVTQGAGVVISAVTFGLYWKVEGRALEPSRVFSGLALFNQLTVPLFILPIIVSHTIKAKSSTKRLQEFFSLPEVESTRIPPLDPLTTLTPLKTRPQQQRGQGVGGGGARGARGGGGGGEREVVRKEDEKRRKKEEEEEEQSRLLLGEVNASRLSRVTEESRPTSTCSVTSTKSNNNGTQQEEEEEEEEEDDKEDEEEEEEEEEEDERKEKEEKKEVELGKKREIKHVFSVRRRRIKEEKDEDMVKKDEMQRDVVVVGIEEGTFTWPPHLPGSPVLQNITTHLPRGGLTVVVGGVGSGKSSLLMALLGEMSTLRGKVRWPG
ncbi:hypothetical protein Pmani_029928 [Petrolisthes manimaculis]|uniref:ABC transmembrane type-1 domain-containing protein n=1 Tax=Petrolisthes manimaculis TaxID=1843537 RepID=A0AAE1TWI9_9EUCA|nr:hypothetical protein Pmani_029928 [Petrolisthes manimaculis]